MDQNVSELCQSIEQMIPNLADFRGSKKKMSLYLLAKLVFGTVLVHREQAIFLEKDVRGLIDSLKQGNLILKCAKKFEKEFKRKSDKDSKRQRSTRLIDLDDGEDLADLEKIAERLEINANPMDITLQDDLGLLPMMNSFIDDLVFMEDMNLFKEDRVLQTTFVDGHLSDGSNRESVVNGTTDIAKKPPVIEQNDDIMDIPPIPPPVDPIVDFSPIPPPIEPITDVPPIAPTAEPIADIVPPAEPVADIAQTAPPVEPVPEVIETAPPIEPIVDIVHPDPRHEENRPKIDDEQNYEPTPKRSKIEIDRDDTTRKTPLHVSNIGQIDEDELELDSQIVIDAPVKPKRARPQRPIYQGLNQIEEKEMMDMRRDYSTLLRNKKDVMVSVQPVFPNLDQLLDPVPHFFRAKKLPSELFKLYGSAKFQDIGTVARDEDEESSIADSIEKDRQEVFLSTFLLPPEESLLEDPIANEQISHIIDLNQDMFDLQPLPPPQPENDTTEGNLHEKVRQSSCLNDIIVPEHRKSILYDANPIAESLEAEQSTVPPTEKNECHFVSSGSLIDARCELENQLFDEVKDAHPDWVSFNAFTDGMTPKMAACAFNMILGFAKEQKVEVKQAGCFEPIFLRELRDDMSTMSIRSGSSLSMSLE